MTVLQGKGQLAQFRGEKLFWSASLRKGMLKTLIMKGVYKKDNHAQPSLDYLVKQILNCVNTKEKWKPAIYTAGAMALYVPYSYRYVSVYMIIPLVMFLREIQGLQRKTYTILFALTFTLPFYGYFTGWGADLFIFIPIYIMMIYSFIEDWILCNKKPA